MSLGAKYIHHRNLLVRGQLELGVILSLINTGMLLGIFLKNILNIYTSYVVVFIVGCVVLTGFIEYMFGRFYEKKGLIHAENDWLTNLTPVFSKLLSRETKEVIGKRRKQT